MRRRIAGSFRAPEIAVDRIFDVVRRIYCGWKWEETRNELEGLRAEQSVDHEALAERLQPAINSTSEWFDRQLDRDPIKVLHNDDGETYFDVVNVGPDAYRFGEGYHPMRLNWTHDMTHSEALDYIRQEAIDALNVLKFDARQSPSGEAEGELEEIIEVVRPHASTKHRELYTEEYFPMADLEPWTWDYIRSSRDEVMNRLEDASMPTLYVKTKRSLGRASAIYKRATNTMVVEIEDREADAATARGVEMVLESIRNSVRHETQHLYQQVLREVEGFPGGESGFEEPEEDYPMKDYLLDPSEFYPKLEDEIDDFKRALEAEYDLTKRRLDRAISVWTAGQQWDGVLERVRPSEVFRRWKDYDRDVWQKAVREFTKEVRERVEV